MNNKEQRKESFSNKFGQCYYGNNCTNDNHYTLNNIINTKDAIMEKTVIVFNNEYHKNIVHNRPNGICDECNKYKKIAITNKENTEFFCSDCKK